MIDERKYVTKEEIEQARQLDLLSYLQRYRPDELVKVTRGVYSLRSHDSLKISNGKWYRWSNGVGGVSALDYLVKVEGMESVPEYPTWSRSLRSSPRTGKPSTWRREAVYSPIQQRKGA